MYSMIGISELQLGRSESELTEVFQAPALRPQAQLVLSSASRGDWGEEEEERADMTES